MEKWHSWTMGEGGHLVKTSTGAPQGPWCLVSAFRHFKRRIASGKTAAESRRNGHVLATFVCVCDCRRIDARAGLELPKRFARVLVERNELTRQFAGEYKSAAGDRHASRTGQIGQRDLPFLLPDRG